MPLHAVPASSRSTWNFGIKDAADTSKPSPEPASSALRKQMPGERWRTTDKLLSSFSCHPTVEREFAARQFNTVVEEVDDVANDQWT
jgi:hypothetical protein